MLDPTWQCLTKDRYMIGIDLGETIRYDADIVVIFEAAVCMIAVSPRPSGTVRHEPHANPR